jgi:hypothetical protein
VDASGLVLTPIVAKPELFLLCINKNLARRQADSNRINLGD